MIRKIYQPTRSHSYKLLQQKETLQRVKVHKAPSPFIDNENKMKRKIKNI